MKKTLTILACLASSLAFASDDINCQKEQKTIMGMKYCSGKKYETLDKTLQAKQKELRTLVGKDRAPYLDQFIAASNKYAEAYCAFNGSQFLGGSMQGLEVIGCMNSEAKRQIKLINELIKDEKTAK